MKQKIILTAFAALFFIHMSAAQTLLHGGIYTNTTWTLANSPYLMDGNVVVFPGVTLTIEPGVEVRVKENWLSGAQYYLETRGTINMIGQPGALITFRGDTALNTIGTWAGIVVKNSQGGVLNYDYVNISNAIYVAAYDAGIPPLIELHQSQFRYNTFAVTVGTELYAEDCTFSGNQVAVYGWSIFIFKNCVFDNNTSALALYASSVNINNCSFTNNNLGVLLNAGAVGGTMVRNSTFDNNIVAFDYANGGMIDSCTFTNNDEALRNTYNIEVSNSGFYNNQTALQVGFGTSVTNCEVNYNGTGIALGPISFGQPMPIVVSNNICYNTAYNIDNRTDLNMFIPTNCFCISDSTTLEAKILDGYDDITKGLISYAIYDPTCSIIIANVNKSPFTGLDELQVSEPGDVFPNPSPGPITILNSALYKIFRIVSLQGQILMEGSLTEGENRIDASSLSAGTYLLSMHDSDKQTRFIKILRH